jgi:thiamine-phosphate pyrophosphorylase
MSFRLIVISSPDPILSETEKITALFKAGLTTFHLRKPGMSKADMEKIIIAIPLKYRSRIVIRDHFSLVKKYELQGMHFTERERKKGTILRIAGKTCSASLHALADAFMLRDQFDYVFISPVFDSISKSALKQQFDLAIVRTFMKEYDQLPGKNAGVIALGGVNEKNVRSVKKAGFDGAALLGAVWKSKDPVKAFLKISSALRK